MNFLTKVFILMAAVFSIASGALGVQCYKDSKLTETKKDRFNFLIASLIISCLLVIFAFYKFMEPSE